MPKRGPRPHIWKIQGEIPHQQHIAWQRMKAQAIYRGESWNLTFDDFQSTWNPYWNQRGRSIDSICLTRIDSSLPWEGSNIACISRKLHLQQNGKYNRTFKK